MLPNSCISDGGSIAYTLLEIFINFFLFFGFYVILFSIFVKQLKSIL